MAMEEIRERAKELCAQMTLQEKAGFLAGEDFWHTKALARLEVEPIRMADGPHGLRKQETGPDGAAIAASTPATCFPTASALACTFDEALARRVGEALGACWRETQFILGPACASRTLFGRLVKTDACFRLLCEGAPRGRGAGRGVPRAGRRSAAGAGRQHEAQPAVRPQF